MGEFAAAKTSVWWDIENCSVPRSCDPQLIVQNMSSALATAGYRGPISISAYGDTHRIAHNVQHALSSTGVSLNHVPAGIKDASDKKILVDMLFWAIDNPPPANYLLISGDRDFSNAIHKLKLRRYNILLAQPQSVSQTLTAAAKSVWLWRSLVAGEPPLAESPYISSTSSGNKDDLDMSKNIISSSSDITQDTNPEVQNILCDPQSDANGMADKKYEVKQPREMQKSNVSKPASKKQQKRSNPGGSGFTEQTASKKSKGGNCRIEHSKFKKPRIGQQKAVPGQGLICYKCGEGHHAAECIFNGDCQGCGKPGHKDRVCKENPNSIVKWMPAHAQHTATSSPGSVHATNSASQLHPTCSSPLQCSQQVTPGVSSSSPAPPVAPAPPQIGDTPSSGPAHSGVYAMPAAVEVGRDDMAQPTTSAPRPPMGVPAYQPGQGQGMICLKCGVVGHCAAECSYIGSCHHCGQLGHMESVCKDNPDSIIKWEQVHAYVSGTSLQGSVHMNVPASQLHQTWAPSSGCFLQATPTVPTPSQTPALPQKGDGPSSVPAHSRVCAMPIALELGREDVVQPTTSAPRPPMAVPAYQSSQGQGMICFKCGIAGHWAAECTYTGSCRRCGQLGHMERVCKENPDSIIKWEQLHAYALAMSLKGSFPMTVPASQSHQKWAPSPGRFLQATPAVPTPSLTPAVPTPSPTPVAPVLPHMGVTTSCTPTQPGVSATPTAVSLGKPHMVTPPTSSALRPPMALLAYRPVLGQYHQVGTSHLLPASTQPPGYFWQMAPVVPSPLLAPHMTPVPLQPGVAASPRPAHYGAFPMLFPFGRPW